MMKLRIQKSTQAVIFSFVVVVLFAASLIVFFHVYGKYRIVKINNQKVEQHYASLVNQKQRLEKIKSYADLANKVNSAIENLNYTSDKWTNYQVDLDKGVSFSELNAILNQTQHGKDYFFIPDKLEITLPEKTLALVEKKNVDAHLKLKGRYLVRQW